MVINHLLSAMILQVDIQTPIEEVCEPPNISWGSAFWGFQTHTFTSPSVWLEDGDWMSRDMSEMMRS